jgi:hypothetical protein
VSEVIKISAVSGRNIITQFGSAGYSISAASFDLRMFEDHELAESVTLILEPPVSART